MAQAHPSPFLHHIRQLVGDIPGARLTDGQLLERFLTDRDEAAIEALVRRYGPLVLGVCRRVLHNVHAAEDAFQATFLVLVRKAPSLDRCKPLGSWLYTVAYRLALRARANEVRRRQCEAEAARGQLETGGAAVMPSDLAVAVEEELQRLPEKHRVPLVLCYLEGKTNEQAAQVLGCPRGSMSWRLSQARDLLRERLTRRGLVCPAAGIVAVLTTESVPAAVPLPLAHNTVRATLWFAAENATAASFVSTQAVTLARGALKAMLMNKLKIAAGLLFAVCLLGTGATMLVKAAPHAEPPAATTTDKNRGPESKVVQAKSGDARLPGGALARMGTTQLRHGDGIFFAAYTPDGKTLLTAGKDQTIRLWDLATRKELRRFERGEAKVDDKPDTTARGADTKPNFGMGIDRRIIATLGMEFQVALSPNGKVVAATRGGTVCLWKTATGEKLHELRSEQPTLTQLVFAADGESVLAIGRNQSMSVWEVAGGKRVKSITGEAVAGQDDAQLAAVSPGLKYFAWVQVDAATQSMSLKVKDLTTGKDLSKIKLSAGGAFVLAFLPDDKTLVSAGFLGGIVEWDVTTGKEVRRLGGGGLVIGDPVTALAFTADGRFMAANRANNTIEVWDLQTGKLARRIGEPVTEGQGMSILMGGMSAMSRSALAFSPDGKRLIASLGGALIRQFDAAKGEEIPGSAEGHRASVSTISLSGDGKSLRTYGPGDPVRFWDLATGVERRKVPLPSKATSAAILADGRFACAAGKNVILCDAAGKEIRKVEAGKIAVEALALSPDGTVLAVRNVLNPQVYLWDATTGKARGTLGQGGEAAKGTGLVVAETAGVVPPDLVFSPDGRFLAGAGPKRQLCVWDVATGSTLWEVAPAAGQTIERFTFSQSGRCLATLNSDGTVSLYETVTGEQRGRLGQPDKKSGGTGLTVSIGGMSLALSNRRDTPVCLAFSPDGRYLAAAKDTPEIRLWDLLSGREVGRLKGHQGGIVSLLFTPDCQRLISGSTDTTALTWDVARLTRGRETRGSALDGPTLETLWQDLAGSDAVRAFEAIRKLSASPAQAVALIRERVRPIASADEKRLARLVADLESDRFEVRRKAESELEGLGELAGTHLRKVLGSEPSLDLRQRVNRLLRKLSGPTPSAVLVRDLRALELLELAGGSESRQVLEALAQGAPDARLTRDAKAAVQRLAKRAALTP